MGRENLTRVIERIIDLPTLPTIFAHVNTLLQDPHTTAAEVARLIESDQALASRVLRLVNSSFFGFGRKVSRVGQAITLLGFNAVRSTVLSVSVFDSFDGASVSGFLRPKFWQHSTGVGLIASSLAKGVPGVHHGEAFAAGVLHDIGKLVLDRYLPEDFTEILLRVRTRGISLREAEREVLGVSHAEIGEYLAEKWNLPHGLVESISLHHTPSVMRSNPSLVSIVHLADGLCRRLKVGYGGDDLIPPYDPFALSELNLSEGDLQEWIPKLQEELQNAQDLFELLT